ncbi:MAG: methanogenesis marker protein Mmp4/MtxX [Methanothrix sp.]|uniref:Putative methyltransferase mtx subunit X n=1 Tax=Methanothrix harundinacea TaxID=301375 RepID=A0A117MD39_9EURY|nr:MAG: Putative methyltransferase mtx subunit X [Methanothrix harundinacea]MDD3710244.1 methanogenesis marker protein Mmp4/MtxX [Methanothrix sp.]MDI9398590.1 methanogenesis marker protein Mmp4/MtxX [Euryarchaeota archaeon]KUK97466.1 MAG: Putative methyltransferase mtx subunit X [Methanothrix harundinacea]MCP1392246.1 methanogenesis marker protein Mmp4/MtxX [Methanothrix harundinacea]
MDTGFLDRMERAAKGRQARIGIGVDTCGLNIIEGIEAASEYAEIVMVGDPGPDCDIGTLEQIRAEDPASTLVGLLEKGEIDGAVRGNLSATRVMSRISKTFEVRVRRLSLLALPDWSFFLAPVGIDEGDSISDRLKLAVQGAEYLKSMDVDPGVSILSGGRLEDLGRCDRVDRTLAEAELLARLARDAGVRAEHRGILIETCRGDDLIVAPDGISGNLIFRTLMLLSGARGFGAPVIMDPVFVDSSRARKNFSGPIMLASALVAMKGR